ncbi:MAG: alanine--tRNA ligase [Fastidiosipilaceae bacterium]
MQKLGLNEIRERFLSFFESKEHLRLPSFSLVPKNDPSVLLINAGMTPLKPYFTGAQTPPAKRVTTCQKCIRTPDIDRVGLTARHGTYFEMLGNFSFGDYFKKEAISWAWEFSTEVLNMPPEQISATVYLDDDEAYDIWRDVVGLPEDRIFRMGKEDNFWEHGTGPCGPCSELFFDRGPEHGCDDPNCSVGCDCDRFVEYWNLVFTQFDRQEDGSYLPLDHKNIDTGAGLERIACIMQDVDNLFETDTVRSVLDKVCELADLEYGKNARDDVGIRVITDHIRSGTMMISDGIRPSNEGRGYVLRRLLRRAARYGKILGIKDRFLTKLSPVVIEMSKVAYPELAERQDYILSVLNQEEVSFEKTIYQGSQMLDEYLSELKESDSTLLPGDKVFKLHDTYGFPVDLTREIASETGVEIDESGFDELMKAQRELSRKATLEKGGSAWNESALPEEIRQERSTSFIGYDKLRSEASVLYLALRGEDDDTVELVAEAGEGARIILVSDQTPFYANSGGQVGDIGKIEMESGVMDVLDTTVTAEGVYLHHGQVESGLIKQGGAATLIVDREQRLDTARNHTATHLLHKALRMVLGEHVTQAGSSVNADRLRFDFHYGEPMSAAQIKSVEEIVNQTILRDLPVETKVMTMEEAKAGGAMALFDEKYGDNVRVVSAGDFSSELCGGTHLRHTSQACFFKILSESSIASGVRRIEALTGRGAFALMDSYQLELEETATMLKTTVPEVSHRVESVLNDLKIAERKYFDLERELAAQSADDLKDQVKDVNGINVLVAQIEAADAKVLREMTDQLREQLKPSLVVLGAVAAGKVLLSAMASPDAVKEGVHAGDIVKEAAKICSGGGGGRPDMAQAGGKNPAKLQEALGAAAALAVDMLN